MDRGSTGQSSSARFDPFARVFLPYITKSIKWALEVNDPAWHN